MEIAERIKQVINYVGLSSYSFEKQAGISTNTIKSVVEGRNKPGYDTLVKIVSKYPQIDPVWLLMGEGEMLKAEKNEPTQQVPTSPEGQVLPPPELNPVQPKPPAAPLQTSTQSEEAILKKSKFQELLKRNNEGGLKGGVKGGLKGGVIGVHLDFTPENANAIYLPEAYVAAGAGAWLQDKYEQVPAYIPGLSGSGYVLVNVSGNSMYPTLKSGDIIAMKEVIYISSLKSGNVYVVMSQEEGWVKRVQWPTEKGKKITLTSDNEQFKPIKISSDILLRVYEVVACLSFNLTAITEHNAALEARVTSLEASVEKLGHLIHTALPGLPE